jgi:phosphoglycerol transferase
MLALPLLGIYLLLSGRYAKLVKLSRRYLNYTTGKVCNFFRKRYVSLASMLLLASFVFFVIRLDAVAYMITTSTPSDFIEEHYVQPDQSLLTFPEQKRNLIYIFLESMENTYAQDVNSDGIVDNYIPELSQLAGTYINFSDSEGIGGALNFDGTTWTAAALVAQTSGLTVKVPLLEGTFGAGDDPYMPGIVSIGDILAEQDYKQVFMMGSVAAFGGREDYISLHGDYEILDLNAMIENGKLPKDYFQWWGYEDAKLFEFAKEELLELAADDQPFNLTMLTADTHFPDGYVCPDCKNDHTSQYANVLACSSKRVYEFITWVQQQDFYQNTTIIISGDHLTMDPLFLADIDPNYTRTVYNCIINSAVQPEQQKNRQFGVYDMYPTTLAAMGVKIEGNRLALGTNLFSGEKTLTEIYGLEYLNEEIKKNSDFYNDQILNVTTPEETKKAED